MIRLRPLLVIAGASVLAPALVALLYAPRAASSTPASASAAEDALLLRLGDSLSAGLSAEGNAAAVGDRLRSELGACGTVRVDGAAISLSAAGCRLRDGRSLGAPLSLRVYRGPHGFTLALTERVPGDGVPPHSVAARR
ncbi:MAG TPA: hypothetical protein VEJ89_09330 [Myxococcaceae bacterium]|nr:hypothetical protein [Myxococcaceae bacterium]